MPPIPLDPSKVTRIVLHCSDSKWGSFEDVDDWHRMRGMSPYNDRQGVRRFCGYHFLIYNGFTSYSRLKDMGRDQAQDGAVVPARPENVLGQHCRPYNASSIGICLIGVHEFTPRQFESLKKLVNELRAKYNIPVENVIGHYEQFPKTDKTCPNFDVSAFRRNLG